MYAQQAREISGDYQEHQAVIDEIKVKLVVAVIYKQKEVKIPKLFLPKDVIKYFKDLGYHFRKGRENYVITW